MPVLQNLSYREKNAFRVHADIDDSDQTRIHAQVWFKIKKNYASAFLKLNKKIIDQSKLTVNDSALSDTPNFRYLVALYILTKLCMLKYLNFLDTGMQNDS